MITTFFSEEVIAVERPKSIKTVELPKHVPFAKENGKEISYYPSPTDWCKEVIYFLLVDRFSDEDMSRPKFDRNKPFNIARPNWFRFDKWAEGGGMRFQGGTLKGIELRLDYLSKLGITAIWISPVFKQRIHNNDYHGYGIQNFLEVDFHFGTRKDLVDLVKAAHNKNIRVLLDVVVNHSGHNFDYEGGMVDPSYKPWPQYYNKGFWIDGNGNRINTIVDDETGILPVELQDDNCFTRAGMGKIDLDAAFDDDHAETRRSDFPGSFRDFNLDDSNTLNNLIRCINYWIALADIDGLRVDTVKHMAKEQVRNFCGAVKEYATNLGKTNFFIMGEIGGGDNNQDKYLDALELNLNAALNIGESRTDLLRVGKGLAKPTTYFNHLNNWNPRLGSHSNSSQRHIICGIDHDMNIPDGKYRYSSDNTNGHQDAALVALQLFTLGIPCIYYGTEQGFSGPETSERKYLPDYGGQDKFLRETMFGAEHPRKSGAQGLLQGTTAIDNNMPGFGAFGTVGYHFFDEDFHVYRRVKEMIKIKKQYPVLSYGRMYYRPIRNFRQAFADANSGELITWSRILDSEEVICIVNGHGNESRGGDIIISKELNMIYPSTFKVILNTAELVTGRGYTGTHPVGSKLIVNYEGDVAYLEIRNVAPSEILLLINS